MFREVKSIHRFIINVLFVFLFLGYNISLKQIFTKSRLKKFKSDVLELESNEQYSISNVQYRDAIRLWEICFTR